jgi:GNAT superfamily N-acetyltransferase
VGRIETVEESDLEHVLTRVLAAPGATAAAPRAQVVSLMSYISAGALEWRALRYCRQRRETALLFSLLLPGRTAIVFAPAPGAPGVVLPDQQRLLAVGLERLGINQLYYVQSLVEPEAKGKRKLLQEGGFRHLTQLIYQQRGATFPWFDPPDSEAAVWVDYAETRHDAFARLLRATYEDSLDCPELTGLRPIDAAIASHKAAGVFDPALWEIACVDGEHAGCILLAPLSYGSLLEIVYMGVAAGWRRRGVGTLLLRRALQQCRALGKGELTAVVDQRNEPARRLYARFGFRQTVRREAYIYTYPA